MFPSERLVEDRALPFLALLVWTPEERFQMSRDKGLKWNKNFEREKEKGWGKMIFLRSLNSLVKR